MVALTIISSFQKKENARPTSPLSSSRLLHTYMHACAHAHTNTNNCSFIALIVMKLYRKYLNLLVQYNLGSNGQHSQVQQNSKKENYLLATSDVYKKYRKRNMDWSNQVVTYYANSRLYKPIHEMKLSGCQ